MPRIGAGQLAIYADAVNDARPPVLPIKAIEVIELGARSMPPF